MTLRALLVAVLAIAAAAGCTCSGVIGGQDASRNGASAGAARNGIASRCLTGLCPSAG